MVEDNSAIAIIPSDCFRWRARVQFIETFQTRMAALDFAFEHGYNLIVERNEGSNALFDVLQDPDRACTADISLELLTNEEVLVEPEATSWTLLMFGIFWNIARQLISTIARVCTREVAPRLRPSAIRQLGADVQRAFRLAWYRHIHWGIRNLNKRFGSAVSLYQSEVVPQCRHAAIRCWWSGRAIAFRRLLHRHLQGSGQDFAKRLPAVMATLYAREVAPRLRHAAIRVRQAEYKAAIRRAWGIAISTLSTLTQQFAVVMASLYAREVAPRLRHAAIQVRQAEYKAAIRRTWSITLLTAIRLVDRFVAAVASFYVREVTPRLRRAAAKYQQAEIEEALRRSIGAVATPSHSNSSQLG